MTIAIVDYGMGNLRSVQKAFERVGAEALIVRQASELAHADRLVLPGVGAFRDAIAELKRLDWVPALKDWVQAGKPFLGICLGMQLLFDVSYEDGEHEGLGIVPGKVVRFELPEGFKVPHMGWNQVVRKSNSPCLQGIADGEYFYFVHSYYVVPNDPRVIALESDYGVRFCAAIAKDNLFATQFHPEKSQRAGQILLGNLAGSSLTPAAR